MAFCQHGLLAVWCATSSPRAPLPGSGSYVKISRSSSFSTPSVLNKRSCDDERQRPISLFLGRSAPSRFYSLVDLPHPESGEGGGGTGGSSNNNNDDGNGNDRNPFNSGEGWRGSSPLVFFILFCCRSSALHDENTGNKGLALLLLSLLGCFCCSQSASAAARTEADAPDGVWEVRGGRWTRVGSDNSNDTFLLAATTGGAFSLSIFLSSWRRLFLGLMLPEGYPHSVSSDYLEYSLWRGVQGVASQISGVLATQVVSLFLFVSSVSFGSANFLH